MIGTSSFGGVIAKCIVQQFKESVGRMLTNCTASAYASVLEPWGLERLASSGRVWPRLAGVWQASGRRLAGVLASGRLRAWDSGARLGHVWARLGRLGLYHARTTSGHVWSRLWSRLATSGHVWSRLVTSGHVWSRLDVWTSGTSGAPP
eukprot:2378261-Prymnesium_polylepis.1